MFDEFFGICLDVFGQRSSGSRPPTLCASRNNIGKTSLFALYFLCENFKEVKNV